jgi:hypothetical protein
MSDFALLVELTGLNPDDLTRALDTINTPPPWWKREVKKHGWDNFILLFFPALRDFAHHVKLGCPGCNFKFIEITTLRKRGKRIYRTYETRYLSHGKDK